ncbi:MAG: sensor domain-containing diguanylate cyclase [Rhodospirillales bacterium]|nr:sensor domain-containing diguanylate cyclase [Rhodospirillales bacterium]
MLFNFFLITIGFIAGAGLAVKWMHKSEIKPELEALQRYRRSQEFSNIGTWDWEIKTDTLLWSDGVFPMFGLKPGEISPTYQLFCDAVHPEDRQVVREAEDACLERKGSHDIEFRVVWPDGTIRWLRETGDVLVDDNGEADRFTGTIRDVTANRREVDRIRQLAHFDSLSGLPNRVLFKIRLEEAVGRAQRHKSSLALIYLDLNKFKKINDSYGHRVGDKVLSAIAEKLGHSMRSIDTIARVGGDEFVAIIEDIQSDSEIKVVVEKLRAVFIDSIHVDGRDHDVGVSIGVSRYPEDSSNIEELVHIADQAMYQAKKTDEDD